MRKILYSFMALWLSGCLFVVNNDSSQIVSLQTDRRPTEQALVDASLEVTINRKLKEQQFAQHARIYTNCFHQHVLVLGQVPQAVMIDRISQIISEVSGVKKIYNEVVVDQDSDYLKRSNDWLITSKIKGKMLLHPNIKPWKILVITEHNTVYLIGLVKPEEELAAVEIAKSTEGVERVVKIFERVI